MEGTVLFFDRKRGHVFAAPADRGSDVYFHAFQLTKDHRYLNEDDCIIFHVGPLAKNHCVAPHVQIVTEAPQSNGGAL